MTPEELLQGLNEPQREAVTHADGPLLVLAGPGSGKTRVITRRAAYLAQTVTKPFHILAITFTNKSAGELLARVDQLGVGPGITCSTFHAFCAKLLRIYADRVELLPSFSIYDTPDQTAAMKETIRRLNLSTTNYPPGALLNAVSKLKNDMVSPDEFAAEARGFQQERIARAYMSYNAVLAEQNAVDFDDLLVKAAGLLAEHADVRETLEDRYRYVLVDEYQDTNRPQYLIANLLTQAKHNLCVTGDPDQSIYAWRGADLTNILQFEKDYPEAVVVRLEQNYRSTPGILAAADSVIANNRSRKEKTLWTTAEAGAPIVVAECEDQHTEATYIARRIQEYADAGGAFSDLAVFYRVNALSRSLEGALRSAHIPYQIARGVAFYQRKEIKDILAYLKVIANPRDQVSLLRIINTPTRGIGKTTVQRVLDYAGQTGLTMLEALQKPELIPGAGRAVRHLQSFATLMNDLRTTAHHGTVQDAVEFVVRHAGLIAMWSNADDDDALENADELINAAAEYDRQHALGDGSLVDWLQLLSLVSDVDAIDEGSGAVTLMTLHAAKGLEFDGVFMAGVEQGLLPHERSEIDRADVEEERRLCFVGMTRARKQLTMTYTKWRDSRGVTHRKLKSQFLDELPEEGIDRVNVTREGDVKDADPDDADIPASSLDFLHWRRGQLVRHASYGLGRVEWIRPSNQRTHAGIHFTAYGEKTMILELANLEVVDPDDLY